MLMYLLAFTHFPIVAGNSYNDESNNKPGKSNKVILVCNLKQSKVVKMSAWVNTKYVPVSVVGRNADTAETRIKVYIFAYCWLQ